MLSADVCARAKVRILRLLTHRGVVSVREVFDSSPDYFYVVLERLAGGPVFDRIVKKVFRRGMSWPISPVGATLCMGRFCCRAVVRLLGATQTPRPYRCDNMNEADTGKHKRGLLKHVVRRSSLSRENETRDR